MTASLEYTDWHLTPTGWRRGTTKLDNGTIQEVPTPLDRIATYRYTEEYPSLFSRPDVFTKVTYQCPNQERELLKLLDQFGACPDQL
jgi:hypothetical protein